MDPISVSASILGLLGAAAKVSEVLTSFIKGVKDAPKLAQQVITEVEDLQVCFHQLQEFVASEASSRRSRKAMVMVDQLVTLLTNCVLTFSELEDTIDGLQARRSFFVDRRLKWYAKEQTLSNLLQRLRTSKLSLNLVVSTMSCSRLQEAQEAMESLTTVVHSISASNENICRRLDNLALAGAGKHRSAPSALESQVIPIDGLPSVDVSRESSGSDLTIVAGDASFRGFAFEQDLRSSRVYARISRTQSRKSEPEPISLPSSTACSIGSSFLSGLSLADVSNASLISLPISVKSLSNGQHYQKPTIDKKLPDLPTDLRPTQWLAPQTHGKVVLLGIANSGKSTILKQLHMMQGDQVSQSEQEEARHTIYAQLVSVFRRALGDLMEGQWNEGPSPTMDFMSECFCHLPAPATDPMHVNVISPITLSVIGQLWRHPQIRWAIESATWPSVPDNVAYILAHLNSIFHLDDLNASHANLLTHVKTVGIYKSVVRKSEAYEFNVIDVGGSRSSRKKWVRCVDGMKYIIFVADLNGYCQRLQEDLDANQMMEALQVFESITSLHPHTPIFLYLNKADQFETTIVRRPISGYFADYKGGADYWKACRYFARRFIEADQRPPGKLHFFVTDSLDTTSFRNAWRQTLEKMRQVTPEG
ncbi:MAG: hypothetical protein Q9220_006200 [cf. Caloplaca sp. 1 TL-2023]